MGESYNILIQKLDEFIRKYYKNLLIRGAIYCTALLFAFFLIVNFLEYFGHFGIITRTILFYSFVLLTLIILWRFVFISLLKLFKIGKIISDEFAAQIIGKHFTEVKDKLLNTLQLKKLNDEAINSKPGTLNSELIRASIDQKISELKPVPFTSAIDLKLNRKYLKYPLIPLAIILIILITTPAFLTEPSKRLLKHDVYFEREAPFQFNIINKNLEAIQQEDYRLDIKLTGTEIPDKAYIIIDNSQFPLERDNTILYHFNFRNIQKDTKFKLFADKFTTKEYLVRVLPKPVILNFSVDLAYPAYTGKKNESLENTGDLLVPAGTKATWKFYTKDTKKIILRFNNKAKTIENTGSPMFSLSDILMTNQNYSITILNQFLKNKDSLVYAINVIPDAFPSIDVEEYHDSLYQKHFYFKGIIKDDYGFSKLSFNYVKIKHQDTSAINKEQPAETKVLPINIASTQQQFNNFFDLSTVQIEPGEEILYYFQVWDNDAVSGPKSSQSQKRIYKEPTKQEIEANSEKTTNQLTNDIKESIKEAKELQDQAEELSRKLLDKKDLNWQEKKQVQDLIDRQKNLQSKMDNIKKQNQDKNVKEDMFNKQMNEDLMQKRDELQKMFDQLMTEDMKKMFKQLDEMMKNLKKDQVNQMLDKMKLTNKDIEKELNRNLQIMKQLEFEKKISEVIDKLQDLSKKEDALSEETKDKKTDNEKLLEKEQNNANDFKDIQKNIDEMQQKNKELEEPNKLMKTDEQEKSIQNEMQNSMNSLKSKNNKNASKSQKNAADKMKDLAQKMQENKDQMEDDEDAEDMDKLRDLLENLVRISYNQENIMQQLKLTSRNDPKYIKLINKQKDIKDDLKMVEDTLYAISKRQIEIKGYVNKKINEINQNIEKTLKALLDSYTVNFTGDGNKSVAITSQQFSMTAINDLALLISESLDQMNQKQSQKQSSCSGKKGKKKMCKNPSSCSKPGGKKTSMKTLSQMQKALNKKLEELKKGMNPFGNSQGKQQQINEQLARMAAEQEAIRKQLQELSDEYKNGGKSTQQFNGMMQQMEQTETELVNKMISQQTLNRQKDILTRLLESEKADLEREIDKKRESNEAKDQNFSNPNKFFEYNKIKLKEDEMLKTSLPTLKPFYKNKVNEYFLKFQD